MGLCNMNFCSLLFQVDRVSYLLQEIYGIENKNNQETKVSLAAVNIMLRFICVAYDLICFLFSFFSHQMMRTVTTATSVLSVCQTCEIHSSCLADICVSATPAPTPCVTRPTTVQSAGCVSTLNKKTVP